MNDKDWEMIQEMFCNCSDEEIEEILMSIE